MKFRLSGEFGELSPVRNWQPHKGIDLAIPENTTLRAIEEGIVDRIYDGTEAIGKGLSIKFPDGSRAIYGHMNKVEPSVGDHVDAGQVIGLSGNTGHSTAAHLHFGLKDSNGSVVDPTPLAEKLANMSGDSPQLGVAGALIEKSTDGLREKSKEMALEMAMGIFDALKELILGATLIASGFTLIMYVAGWRDGGRWTGMLIVLNILIKFLFGVY